MKLFRHLLALVRCVPNVVRKMMEVLMSITLSAKEIMSLAIYAGISVDENSLDEDEGETKYVIEKCPENGVVDEDIGVPLHYNYIASLDEYPEEGVYPLGDELVSH